MKLVIHFSERKVQEQTKFYRSTQEWGQGLRAHTCYRRLEKESIWVASRSWVTSFITACRVWVTLKRKVGRSRGKGQVSQTNVLASGAEKTYTCQGANTWGASARERPLESRERETWRLGPREFPTDRRRQMMLGDWAFRQPGVWVFLSGLDSKNL